MPRERSCSRVLARSDDDTLFIHGESLSGDTSYPFIAEKLDLLLGRKLFDGHGNAISRPIYLPALDLEHARTIDPASDTAVQVSLREGEVPAEVFVQAGTLRDQAGNAFDGRLSITEVPVSLTPAALPDSLFPGTVVTIQPGEMQFTAPGPAYAS